MLYYEKFRNFIAWAEPDPKQTAFFAFLGYPWTILRIAYRKQFYPRPMVPMESRDSGVCLLLVWRVCDQAFGRYRPLKVPKSGHVTITKIENLHIDTRIKIH